MRITLGPAGTSGLGYDKGIPKVAESGLGALEVAFTYGVRMSNQEASRVGQIARNNGIKLSVHAPYYINLASKDRSKIKASIKRILDSCERAHHLQASPVVFHAGFFQGQEPAKVKEKIVDSIKMIMQKVDEKRWRTKISPELTGKQSQFGSVDELLELKSETGCGITIDFAHQKARNQGKPDYKGLLKKLKQLDHMHAHYSGIEWTPKGERRHLLTSEKDIRELLLLLISHHTDITLINESPDPIADSIKTKKILEKLQNEKKN